MAAARLGGKVLVLTVDPARRLADALGLEGIGNTERRVPDEAFLAAGVKPMGELWAAMLDTKESWDSLIRLHAPDAAHPRRDPVEPAVPQHLGALRPEPRLHRHGAPLRDPRRRQVRPHRGGHARRRATPSTSSTPPSAWPSSSRAGCCAGSSCPYRSRLVNFASKPFYQIADRILGTQFLEDVAQFFILFQSMYDGFVERAKAVHRLMADRRTSFIVVSTLEAVPLREAEFFAQALKDRRLHLGAIVLNKVLPAYLRDPSGAVGGREAARPGRRARRGARAQGPLGRRRARSAGCCRRWVGATSTTAWWPSARPSSRPSWPRCPRRS